MRYFSIQMFQGKKVTADRVTKKKLQQDIPNMRQRDLQLYNYLKSRTDLVLPFYHGTCEDAWKVISKQGYFTAPKERGLADEFGNHKNPTNQFSARQETPQSVKDRIENDKRFRDRRKRGELGDEYLNEADMRYNRTDVIYFATTALKAQLFANYAEAATNSKGVLLVLMLPLHVIKEISLPLRDRYSSVSNEYYLDIEEPIRKILFSNDDFATIAENLKSFLASEGVKRHDEFQVETGLSTRYVIAANVEYGYTSKVASLDEKTRKNIAHNLNEGLQDYEEPRNAKNDLWKSTPGSTGSSYLLYPIDFFTTPPSKWTDKHKRNIIYETIFNKQGTAIDKPTLLRKLPNVCQQMVRQDPKLNALYIQAAQKYILEYGLSMQGVLNKDILQDKSVMTSEFILQFRQTGLQQIEADLDERNELIFAPFRTYMAAVSRDPFFKDIKNWTPQLREKIITATSQYVQSKNMSYGRLRLFQKNLPAEILQDERISQVLNAWQADNLIEALYNQKSKSLEPFKNGFAYSDTILSSDYLIQRLAKLDQEDPNANMSYRYVLSLLQLQKPYAQQILQKAIKLAPNNAQLHWLVEPTENQISPDEIQSAADYMQKDYEQREQEKSRADHHGKLLQMCVESAGTSNTYTQAVKKYPQYRDQYYQASIRSALEMAQYNPEHFRAFYYEKVLQLFPWVKNQIDQILNQTSKQNNKSQPQSWWQRAKGIFTKNPQTEQQAAFT